MMKEKVYLLAMQKRVNIVFTALFALVAMSGSVKAQMVRITYQTVNTDYTATIPCGSINAKGEAWGGGGGGGGVYSGASCQANAGGGGGGAYILKNFSGGTSLTLRVGSGGARGANNSDGSDGGNSTITYSGVTAIAGGGKRGTRHECAGANNNNGTGGQGGTPQYGDVNTVGGNGYNYNSNPASSGGYSPNGGVITGQPSNGNNAIQGKFPGGGGSGARAKSIIIGWERQPGADGANGQVIVSFNLGLTIDGATTYCSGSTLNLAVANPCPSATYTWKRDGSVVVGTGSTLTLNNITTAMTGTYTVEVNIGSHSYPGATSVTATGLPTGISWNGSTLSGTLTSTGVAVTVYPRPVLTHTSGSTTQTVCQNTAITSIVYSLSGGATGASVTGLPAGVTGVVAGNTLTISGTPTAAGTFNYTITTTGHTSPCTAATALGTITVNVQPQISNMTASSCSGTACSATPVNGTNGTVPSGTTYTWTVFTPNAAIGGASGGNSGTGSDIDLGTLTSTSNISQNVVYNVTPTTGTCAGASFTLTVTVYPEPSAEITSPAANGDLCQGDVIEITFTGRDPFTLNYTVKGDPPATYGFPTTFGTFVSSSNGVHKVELPISAAGVYPFVISSVTDGNSCTTTY
jgi:hypothetical protein